MSIRRTVRLAPALPLLALALAACGGLDGGAAPQPATRAVALESEATPGGACGTFDRPCLLQEIRVDGAAGE